MKELQIHTNAHQDDSVTETEKRAAAVALEAAKEGIILLKNDGALPLTGKRLALYGDGAVQTFKGGTGSGEVNPRHVVSIREGIEKAGFFVTTERWLDDFAKTLTEAKAAYRKEMRNRTGIANFKAIKYLLAHPFNSPAGREITEKDLSERSIPCLYVISRQTGENADRRLEEGQLYLSAREIRNISFCCEHYDTVILIINAGGYVELSPLEDLPLKGILFFCQQGQEGGHALASILSGETSPSAHLTFTWPRKYTDVPFAMEFGTLDGKPFEDDYKEGIYIGYRYFSSFHKEVAFPFGYGLSYTRFSRNTKEVKLDGGEGQVLVSVRNTGKRDGKEVLQIYVACPRGDLEKEEKRLIAFAKTCLLKPGEEELIQIPFRLEDMASFDEAAGETILEAGRYELLMGSHVEDTHCIAVLTLSRRTVLSRHTHICPMKESFRELSVRSEGSLRESEPADWAASDIPLLSIDDALPAVRTFLYQEDAILPTEEERKLLDRLSDLDKTDLIIGSGNDIAIPGKHAFLVPGAGGYTTSRFEKRGIPSIPMADGPAGLRLFDLSVVKGKKVHMARPVMAFMEYLPLLARKMLIGNPKRGQLLYQYAVAYPVGMALASSWNTNLMEKVGRSVQAEMEEFGIRVWLSPGINLYRNPLCGRTYEYYSEDPVLSGRLAAALIRGVQSKAHYFATVKHFCCNNREVERRYASSNLHERPLRELYLKSFEIAVREGRPACLMTSYNKINHVYAAENYDLITKVVRNEWNYDGLIMTDWTMEEDTIQAAKCVHAGMDLFMQGAAYQHRQLKKDLKKRQYMTISDLDRSAARVMRLIVNSTEQPVRQRTENNVENAAQ